MTAIRPTLIVITGPTGSGKTDLSVRLARRLGCHIISADSRQIFKSMPIGTAMPSAEQLEAAPHHFIGMLEPDRYYSAAQFEADTISLLEELFATDRYAIMCGGSMMYVDAVCNGIDELPTISTETRRLAYDLYTTGGLDAIRQKLREIDPDYYAIVDHSNHKRIIHAIEITLEAGTPFSKLRTGKVKPRPFDIVKVALDYDRATLFDRINLRVDKMIESGLEEEARTLLPKRHLNSLNTVGYKEMFAMMDGTMDHDTAIARMKKNTRVYAKKQLTWLKKDPKVKWLNPDTAFDDIMHLLGL